MIARRSPSAVLALMVADLVGVPEVADRDGHPLFVRPGAVVGVFSVAFQTLLAALLTLLLRHRPVPGRLPLLQRLPVPDGLRVLELRPTGLKVLLLLLQDAVPLAPTVQVLTQTPLARQPTLVAHLLLTQTPPLLHDLPVSVVFHWNTQKSNLQYFSHMVRNLQKLFQFKKLHNLEFFFSYYWHYAIEIEKLLCLN